MLDIANKYEKELQELLMNTWYDDKYKFYHDINWRNLYKASESNWDRHEFVSKDKNNKIIGYISYGIKKDMGIVSNVAAINFTNNHLLFGKDLHRVLKDIFEKFNFRKINFGVVIGNPIEESYDKIVLKHGGRIVGIKKEDALLDDNKFYDYKMYEILRNDYLKIKNDRRIEWQI